MQNKIYVDTMDNLADVPVNDQTDAQVDNQADALANDQTDSPIDAPVDDQADAQANDQTNTIKTAESDEILERLYRVCVFSILFLSFCTVANIPQENLLYLTLISSVCYMFVSMCYPTVAVNFKQQ